MLLAIYYPFIILEYLLCHTVIMMLTLHIAYYDTLLASSYVAKWVDMYLDR